MFKRWGFLSFLMATFLICGMVFSIEGADTTPSVLQVIEQDGTRVAQIAIATATPTRTRTPTPINIGNLVWDDLDKDGRQDVGEPGLAGVTVQLWNSTKTSLLAQTTTNSNGNYTVTAPLPGNYRIRVVLASGTDSFTIKDAAGGDNQLDSDINPSGADAGFTDVFNLATNVISTTVWDAGIIVFRLPTPTRTPTPINIGNFVWRDLDGDGIQDTGEPGLAGVTVQLWNDTKTQLLDDAITNSTGGYTVTAAVPGNYRLRVLPPSGMTLTLKNQGFEDTKDSDFTRRGTDAGFTDVFNIANNVISTTMWDAGLIPLLTSTPTAGPWVELLADGSFEIDAAPVDAQPDAWGIVSPSKDRQVCNTPTLTQAHVGQCAFVFVSEPGEMARLTQTVNLSGVTITAGDTLDFSVFYRTVTASPQLKVIVRVFYSDGTNSTFNHTLTTSSATYIPYYSPLINITGTVTEIKVQFYNTATGGKIFIDGASLRLMD